jgi:hypothetical protein
LEQTKKSYITALLDDTQLAAVHDSTHTHGMFALGTEWDHIQFDNLKVTSAQTLVESGRMN